MGDRDDRERVVVADKLVGPHRATARHVSRSRADTRSLLSGRFRRVVAFSPFPPPSTFRSQLPFSITDATHRDKYDAH